MRIRSLRTVALPVIEPGLGPAAVDAGKDLLNADLLIDFFRQRGRDLPWRRSAATPWAVLVSEVMLQQTPVVRVLPVYDEWLTRWPTPTDLAADSPGDAIRAWGRLGYPRRAMRLHAAATAITAEHHGVVPSSIDELLRLPGIGEYTARAVAAFAFGARTPVIDTNVRRVLARAVRGRDEPREPATARDRAELADLLPAEPATAALFSAAVMELGALVCTARNPSCGSCPLAERCRWRRAGAVPGQARRTVQTWHGTDRQVRGRILSVLRVNRTPVPEIAFAYSDVRPDQLDRCLTSLLADGLVVRVEPAHIGLPD